MNIQTIITHPGGAHKDDFLACSLMIAESNAPILRRDPTEEELENPNICVIDIGNRHEAEKNNFDHHQFPRDHEPTCALSLILKHLGIYDDAKMFCDWLEPAEWFDTRGPKKTAEWLGVERDIVSKMNSPIDMTMLGRFARAKQHEFGEPVYELMRMIGEDLISYLKGVRERLNFVQTRVQRWEINAGDESFSVLFLPRTEEKIEDASSGLARYILVNELDQEIAAIVYPDSRGTGFGLARFNDHPKLYFCRVEGEADVHFTHNSGFLCKTSTTDENLLRKYLSHAWG